MEVYLFVLLIAHTGLMTVVASETTGRPKSVRYRCIFVPFYYFDYALCVVLGCLSDFLPIRQLCATFKLSPQIHTASGFS